MDEEKARSVMESFHRYVSIASGVAIIGASLLAVSYFLGAPKGSRPVNLLPLLGLLAVLDLAAVYWIVSAIKPEFKIANLIPEAYLDEDFDVYFVPASIIASDILVVSVADSLLFPAVYLLFTVPIAGVLVYNIVKD